MFRINHQVTTLYFMRTEPFKPAKVASCLRGRRDNIGQREETVQWLRCGAWLQVNA